MGDVMPETDESQEWKVAVELFVRAESPDQARALAGQRLLEDRQDTGIAWNVGRAERVAK